MVITILNKLTELMLAPVWENIANNMTRILLGSPGAGGFFSGGFLTNIFNGFSGISRGAVGTTARTSRVAPSEFANADTSRATSVANGNLAVHVHENARDGQTEVKQSNGRIDIYLRKMVSDTIAGGGADKAMRSRYNVGPKATGI